MTLCNVDTEKWYKVEDVAKILGWSKDVIRRWVRNGQLQAFIKPVTSPKRKRIWMGVRIQGAEIIRFVKENLSSLSEKKVRVRIA